jgi:CubicO group peptidase (beta-lactamase class C family)
VSPTLPRLPLAPDPLRRIHVRRDLAAITTVAEEAEPTAGGMTEESIEKIWQSALSLYRSGAHPAVAVCVRRNGVVVLDRAVGHARGNGPKDDRDTPKVAATPGTPFVVYSIAKAITAIVVHLLDERGVLHIGDRVAEYIPDYGCHGKEGVTIAQVLAHRSGVPSLPREAIDLDRIGDPDFILEHLCAAKPSTRPGRNLSYHATSGGFILAEVVRRATNGRDIRQVLEAEILDPLGFRWNSYGVRPEDIDAVAKDELTGPPMLPPLSTLLTRALGLPLDELVALTTDPRFLTAIVPAANIVTTANELSRFFELLRCGGLLDGKRILEPRTIRRALTEQSHLEVDLSLGFPTRFSLGLMLGAKRLSLYGFDTDEAFGHLGFTNMMGWADPERAISVGVITSGKPALYPEMHRFYGLLTRITKESPKAPAGERAF